MQSFSELPLSPELLRAIKALGFETPSPIQQQALPLLLAEPTDFVGLAGTGTGKTAAFSIPLLEKIDPKKRVIQAVVLCPTRELAMQVAGQIDLLGRFKGVRSVTVYGGASFAEQVRGIRTGATVVVGTPGRVIDHIKRETLSLENVKLLVLDEADEMFSMGFKEELDTIVASMPKEESNTWLFSATMSNEVRSLTRKNLRDPKAVQVNRTEVLSSNVEQYFYRTQEYEKPEMICKLIEGADDFYGIIFCQTKALVSDLTAFLADRGYRVDSLHGDKDQTAREHTMQAFRDRKVSILVCTDVAARGLDVKDITHVVNYSLPREVESYVHRIGRTARSGKTGTVMNLLTMSHRHLLGRIEQHTKVRMKEGFVPTVREIGAKKVAKILPRFEEQPHYTRVLEVMNDEFKAKLKEMTPEQVAGHFIAMMMPDVFGVPDSRKTKKAQTTTTAPMVVKTNGETVKPASHGDAPVVVAAKPVVEAVQPVIEAEVEAKDSVSIEVEVAELVVAPVIEVVEAEKPVVANAAPKVARAITTGKPAAKKWNADKPTKRFDKPSRFDGPPRKSDRRGDRDEYTQSKPRFQSDYRPRTEGKPRKDKFASDRFERGGFSKDKFASEKPAHRKFSNEKPAFKKSESAKPGLGKSAKTRSGKIPAILESELRQRHEAGLTKDGLQNRRARRAAMFGTRG